MSREDEHRGPDRESSLQLQRQKCPTSYDVEAEFDPGLARRVSDVDMRRHYGRTVNDLPGVRPAGGRTIQQRWADADMKRRVLGEATWLDRARTQEDKPASSGSRRTLQQKWADADLRRRAVGDLKYKPSDAAQVQEKTADATGHAVDDTHAAAEQGVATPARPLPHADRIQSSFGPDHDVRSIRAHIDPASTRAMGAEAYATGNDVVFAKEPDVELAAHEAAHTVQQAQGVQLKGGVGEVGDSYEQNADAVAARVTAGKSAADLLGPATASGARAEPGALQHARRAAFDDETSTPFMPLRALSGQQVTHAKGDVQRSPDTTSDMAARAEATPALSPSLTSAASAPSKQPAQPIQRRGLGATVELDAPRPASVETIESRLVEALRADETEREGRVLAVLAELDQRTRRDLADKLEQHRAGTGGAMGEISTRFWRLEPSSTPRKLLAALRSPEPIRPTSQNTSTPDATSASTQRSASVPEPSRAVVQRKVGDQPGAAHQPAEHATAQTPQQIIEKVVAANKPDVWWAYFRANEDRFMAAIENRLAGFPLVEDKRLVWGPNGLRTQFRHALKAALGEPLFIKLREFLYPADPMYTIDAHRILTEGSAGVVVDGREPVGPMAWNALAGEALATDVIRGLRDSFARMVPRYLVQAEEKHPSPVTPSDLVTSHPIDRVTALLLCDEHVVTATVTKPKAAHNHDAKKKKRPQPPPEDPRLFREGVRFLQSWRWLGEVDPKLWNYVEVHDRDATPEDVAVTLWLDPEKSYLAYAITQSGPYFRVDPRYARKFVEDPSHSFDEPHKDNVLDLAGSALATDAAIAQAKDERKFDKRGIPLPPDLEKLDATLAKSYRQLVRTRESLGSTKLWELLVPALQWVSKYREHLFGLPQDKLIALTPVIEGQQEVLFEAAGAVADIAAASSLENQASPGRTNSRSAVIDTLREYAIAMGESHLVDSSRAQLGRAREAKASLSLALLDDSARDTGGAVQDLVAKGGGQWGGDHEMQYAIDRARIVDMRAKQAAGQTVDPKSVAVVAASLKEQGIDAKSKSLYHELSDLMNAARDSLFGGLETIASAFDSNARELPGKISAALADLRETVIDPHERMKQDELQRAGTDEGARAVALDAVANRSQQNLAAFIERHDLKRRIGIALKIIEHQQKRTMIAKVVTQIAIMIGASMVGGVAGNVVAGYVRGALVADAATASLGMLRAAQTAGFVAGLGVDAGINASVQLAVHGGSASEALVGNLLGTAAVRAALAPIMKAAETWGHAADEIENVSLWQKTLRGGKLVAKQGVILTTSMITGAATDYVVKRMYNREPPSEKEAVDWALEGGSLAIGMFVGQWLHGFEQRLVHIAEHAGQLRARAGRLRSLVKEIHAQPNGDTALEAMIQRHEALQEEARVIENLAHPGSGISPEMIRTLRTGNQAELAAVKDKAFDTVPLRLAGLEPDDASGKIWTGTTEDIAIALDQAHRVGLAVEVLAHDTAARQWRIRYNHEELTILETPLRGQPRPAKAEPTDADLKHAARYAEAAEFMQQQWEARIKRETDSREVVETDHLQVGYAFAGVVNQATLPATGPGLDKKLIVYQHKGTLSYRGAQELGQSPEKLDASGVRASEQAPKDQPWLKSEQLDRALAIGRIETQTPAYQGTATELQTREKAPPGDPWKAPNRKFRVKIRDAHQVERWFYCDRIDEAVGLGPGSTKQLEKAVDPAQMSAMMSGEHPQVLLGDDPHYIEKVKRGRVLVWGGTPTGAWAAEPVGAHPGASATILGETRPATDWHALFGEYADVQHEIALHPSEQVPQALLDRKRAIEARIADAHGGSKIRRNRKHGAPYEKPPHEPRQPGEVKIEFGSPTRLTPTEDGRVLVTVGTGENASTSVYDQVVIAHGQDPGAPGGPGHLLGPGAAAELGVGGEYGEVPDGTIALRPIWGPMKDGRQDILGLESIDPTGIQLKGAAFASKRMSPWLEKGERARFEAAIDAMANETAQTRDYGPISDDSRNVPGGMEAQRDRVPRANEIVGAKSLRLPGADHVLELDPAHPEHWDDRVREFFAIHLRARDKWIQVKRFGGGATKAVIYHVSVDGTEVGVFKLFDGAGGAAQEQKMLELLASAKLKHMTAVKQRGTIGLDPATGLKGGGLLMDAAPGASVKEMIDALPAGAERRDKLNMLKDAVTRVAEGLAEMHQKFGHNEGNKPAMMTRAAKEDDANYFLNNNFREGGADPARLAAMKTALGNDFARVKAKVEGPMLDEFLDADVPATAYHGDANAGNFKLDGDKLAVFDVGSMQYSIDPSTKLGIKTGAADVARFLNSLETLAPGKLSASELDGLREAFAMKYFEAYRVGPDRRAVDQTAYAKAARWYQIEMEVAILRNDARAKARLLSLLGLDGGT